MGKLTREELLSQLDLAEEKVLVDETYIHIKSGNRYLVAGFVFIEATMQLDVTYYDPTEPRITFSRNIDEFLERFKQA